MQRNPTADLRLAPALERRIGRIIGVLARALAWLGGLVLVALVVMTCISIAGRALVTLDVPPGTPELTGAAVTEEPAGGSSQPTSPILVSGTLEPR